MENFSTLDLVERIRDYQDQHPILKLKIHPYDPSKNTGSHHFVFDLPLGDSATKPEFIWVGVNPGNDEGDEEILGVEHDEETRYRDWQSQRTASGKVARTSGSNERLNYIKQVLGEENFNKTTQTQIFFWCSRDTSKNGDFLRRYGEEFEESKHIQFCTEMNLQLIERIGPKAIFFESHAKFKIFQKFYRNIREEKSFDALGRSVKMYLMNGKHKIIVIDHLSFLNKRFQTIRNVRGTKQEVIRRIGEIINEIIN